ncbi:MAG: aminoglycoside phosphotransferase family protein [Betaproteobacteria bacterium]
MYASLRRMAVVSADTEIRLVALEGGVSSAIYRVDAAGGTFCVKRALPKLKVAGDWRAPVERNRSEVDWLRYVSSLCPGHVPAILGDDAEGGAFAMTWLPPTDFPTWKALLRDGRIDAADAGAVGDLLGRIHAATADNADIARAFAHDAIFHSIRLEPYLVATGRAHPDLAAHFAALVVTTQSQRRVLVHGDYSPKNILIGADGPVILDAECACFGDPAFDVAFVLNHLLLKGVWRPQWRALYMDALDALVEGYRRHAGWESWAALDARVAALLPALMLARVDGKSPAEYLDSAADQDAVRAFARPRVAEAPQRIGDIVRDWRRG